MSEQKKILNQLQELIMEILKTGIASEEQADKLDALEERLHQEACFQTVPEGIIGEVITQHLLNGAFDEAIALLKRHNIDAEDYLDFIDYHYEEEEEIEGIDQELRAKVKHACA
jgi:restriction endonuclease S subunit